MNRKIIIITCIVMAITVYVQIINIDELRFSIEGNSYTREHLCASYDNGVACYQALVRLYAIIKILLLTDYVIFMTCVVMLVSFCYSYYRDRIKLG